MNVQLLVSSVAGSSVHLQDVTVHPEVNVLLLYSGQLHITVCARNGCREMPKAQVNQIIGPIVFAR